MQFSIIKTQVSLDERQLEILWNDSHISRFHVKWLRFYCPCSKCQSEKKGTYLVDYSQFPEEISIKSVQLEEKGTILQLRITDEVVPGHVCTIPSQWLRSYCYCDACLAKQIDERDVIGRHPIESSTSVPMIDYQEMVDEPDKGYFKWLKIILEKGFCVVRNVPTELETILKVVGKIGPVRETIYGKCINIDQVGTDHGANTSHQLPFHSDQPTYETKIGLLAMHCIQFDDCMEGGKSKIINFFQAAEILRDEFPEDFRTLTEVPSGWETKSRFSLYPTIQEHRKCHIELDYYGKIVSVNWNPELGAPLRAREEDVDRYFKATRRYFEILEREELQVVCRLQPGDLLSMNNKIMGHARTEYRRENGKGVRHMQLVYANIDDVKSRYLYLAEKLGYDVLPPKTGNRSSF